MKRLDETSLLRKKTFILNARVTVLHMKTTSMLKHRIYGSSRDMQIFADNENLTLKTCNND